MKLPLTEEDLTAVINQTLIRFKDKPFWKATYEQTDKGLLIQFWDGPAPERYDPPGDERPDDYSPPAHVEMPHIVNMPSSGGFGSFGGGQSGGGGASGNW